MGRRRVIEVGVARDLVAAHDQGVGGIDIGVSAQIDRAGRVGIDLQGALDVEHGIAGDGQRPAGGLVQDIDVSRDRHADRGDREGRRVAGGSVNRVVGEACLHVIRSYIRRSRSQRRRRTMDVIRECHAAVGNRRTAQTAYRCRGKGVRLRIIRLARSIYAHGRREDDRAKLGRVAGGIGGRGGQVGARGGSKVGKFAVKLP